MVSYLKCWLLKNRKLLLSYVKGYSWLEDQVISDEKVDVASVMAESMKPKKPAGSISWRMSNLCVIKNISRYYIFQKLMSLWRKSQVARSDLNHPSFSTYFPRLYFIYCVYIHTHTHTHTWCTHVYISLAK